MVITTNTNHTLIKIKNRLLNNRSMFKKIFGSKSENEVVVSETVVVEDKSAPVEIERVQEFLSAFMTNHRIDPKLVLVKDIISKWDGVHHRISIITAFSGALIGPNGQTVKKISRGLSRYLDKKIKVEIK